MDETGSRKSAPFLSVSHSQAEQCTASHLWTRYDSGTFGRGHQHRQAGAIPCQPRVDRSAPDADCCSWWCHRGPCQATPPFPWRYGEGEEEEEEAVVCCSGGLEGASERESDCVGRLAVCTMEGGDGGEVIACGCKMGTTVNWTRGMKSWSSMAT